VIRNPAMCDAKQSCKWQLLDNECVTMGEYEAESELMCNFQAMEQCALPCRWSLDENECVRAEIGEYAGSTCTAITDPTACNTTPGCAFLGAQCFSVAEIDLHLSKTRTLSEDSNSPNMLLLGLIGFLGSFFGVILATHFNSKKETPLNQILI